MSSIYKNRQLDLEYTMILELPCGATGEFDYPSGIGYRCTTCGAIWGSVSMPKECREIKEMDDIANKLRGNT